MSLKVILRFVDFEWDEEKAAANAAANIDKHAVTFEEARSVFRDPLLIDFYDPDHSVDEHLSLMIGQSVVC